ncbi:MAG: PH domain-containing protein [Candidatus Heimdallarchaeota archaeon]
MSNAVLIKGDGVYPEPEVRHIRPHSRLLWKYMLIILGLWIICLIIIIAVVWFLGLLLSDAFSGEILDFFVLVSAVLTGLFFVPILILLPFYVRSMLYIVHGDEVVVHKGIINRTVKHCPYRNIVNISTNAGPLDRVLGIGNVNIETAGASTSVTEPEERLEGLRLYAEIRDYILRQIRTFQSIESDLSTEKDVPYSQEDLQRESLMLLKEIRDLLRERGG